MKKSVNAKPVKTVFLAMSFLILVSVMSLVHSGSLKSASDEEPKIVFTEETHDFGKVEEGTNLEYSFIFTNEGDKPLRIEKVQPSCGCTGAATDGKEEYTSKEAGEIKVTFNTQGRSGHIEKNISVLSNDTVRSNVSLKIICDIMTNSDN